MLMAVHNRAFVQKRTTQELHPDMMSNLCAIRGMVLIMVVPFSHLAHILPRFGEENEERKKDGFAWLRKFVLWNAYLTHVAAAQAGWLAFRELDLELWLSTEAAPKALSKAKGRDTTRSSVEVKKAPNEPLSWKEIGEIIPSAALGPFFSFDILQHCP